MYACLHSNRAWVATIDTAPHLPNFHLPSPSSRGLLILFTFILYSRAGWDSSQGVNANLLKLTMVSLFLRLVILQEMDTLHNSGQWVKSVTSGEIFLALKKMEIRIPILLFLNITVWGCDAGSSHSVTLKRKSPDYCRSTDIIEVLNELPWNYPVPRFPVR